MATRTRLRDMGAPQLHTRGALDGERLALTEATRTIVMGMLNVPESFGERAKCQAFCKEKRRDSAYFPTSPRSLLRGFLVRAMASACDPSGVRHPCDPPVGVEHVPSTAGHVQFAADHPVPPAHGPAGQDVAATQRRLQHPVAECRPFQVGEI